jgi:hypothetical protein
VTLRGGRIRTVDVHAHCVVAKAADLLKRQVNRHAAHLLEGQPLAERMQQMAAQGSDAQREAILGGTAARLLGLE